MKLNLIANLSWCSDWQGDEVGFPDSLVVGLYSLRDNPSVHLYIDVETMEILDMWKVED